LYEKAWQEPCFKKALQRDEKKFIQEMSFAEIKTASFCLYCVFISFRISAFTYLAKKKRSKFNLQATVGKIRRKETLRTSSADNTGENGPDLFKRQEWGNLQRFKLLQDTQWGETVQNKSTGKSGEVNI